MSRLLSRWQQPNAEGRTQSVTPESAGWGYVGFEAYELQEGQVLTLPAINEERCLVLVAGRASISTPSAQFNDIGERMSPFERIKPWAVYVTPQETVQVTALTTLELAVCAAPGKGTYPTRLIAPQDIDGEARGKARDGRLRGVARGLCRHHDCHCRLCAGGLAGPARPQRGVHPHRTAADAGLRPVGVHD